MNQKGLGSAEKRTSLKKLRNAGIGTTLISGALAGGWIRPAVAQVDLPQHACTTQCVEEPTIEAVLLRCSGDGPLEVTISSSCPIIISTQPTLSCTPTPNDWGIDVNSPPAPAVPFEVFEGNNYVLVFAGSVQNQDTCYPPMTDVPLADPPPQPITSMVVSFDWICPDSGVTSTASLDVLDTLVAP